MTALSSKDQAIRLACASNFHQALWLPETVNHSKLRITFSTTTNFENVSLPAILFIGPIFGTRYVSLNVDKLARDCGVRVICVDRPAFGGSTPVAVNIRMQVWLELVPALLQRVDVKSVALVTHSAGAVYTMNTLFHHRSLLDPKAPYVAFLAPWVPTKHSRVILTTALAILPANMLDSCAGLVSFISTKIKPSASWSEGIISSTAARLSFSSSTDIPGAETSNSTTPFERYGFDDNTAKLIEKYSSQYLFAAEGIEGSNEEAKLCLRKCEDADWGEAADYSKCVSKIAAKEETLGRCEPDAAKLTVDAFFAKSDNMIGKRGQLYFEKCWQSDKAKEKVDFTTSTLPEATHDSVLVDYKKGALKIVFERIAERAKNGS